MGEVPSVLTSSTDQATPLLASMKKEHLTEEALLISLAIWSPLCLLSCTGKKSAAHPSQTD